MAEQADRQTKGWVLQSAPEPGRILLGGPVRNQWTALKRKLLGHFAYFGITGNYQALHNFYIRAIGLWRKWLSRRSQRAWISIERMKRLLQHYPLPTPRLRSSRVT